MIPFRNEEKNLPHLILSIQKLKEFPAEFIFINDHSSDQSSELILNSSINNFKFLNLEKENGKKQALAQGVYFSKTKYVLCIDADAWFNPNYFSYLSSKNIADITVLPVKCRSTTLIQTFFDLDYYYLNALSFLLSKYHIFIQASGANLLVNKELYIEYLKNDKNQNIKSGDDYFLLQYAIKKKFSIQNICEADLSIQVQNPRLLKDFFHQRIRWYGKTTLSFNSITFIICLISLYCSFLWVLSLFSNYTLLSLGIKIIFDGILLFYYLFKIRELKKLFLLPIFSLLQIPYYLLIIFLTLFWKVNWKNREI
ncbi:MAG: glycosyltransferase [Flavobacteriia bacterium]|nr:glycosyltransferase [Flavobacteriia bacterium]